MPSNMSLTKVLILKIIIHMPELIKHAPKMVEISRSPNSPTSLKVTAMAYKLQLLNNQYQLQSMLSPGNSTLEEFSLHSYVDPTWTTVFWLLVMIAKATGLSRTAGENYGEKKDTLDLAKVTLAVFVMLLVSHQFEPKNIKFIDS